MSRRNGETRGHTNQAKGVGEQVPNKVFQKGKKNQKTQARICRWCLTRKTLKSETSRKEDSAQN